ncbi:HAMP domain-containing histidine kinase [Myxococcota bacterium]|nr:HAMP domain-containing histidine kinase [Myxococcota bacterium]
MIGSYLAASVAWILVSDQVAERWLQASHPWVQTAKGLLFVGVTAAVIGLVLHRELRARAAADRLVQDLHRELEARAEELERRVAQRTADLSAALARAEAADRVKTQFLATMSHELRTPLNSIIGFSAILEQQLPGPLNPEQLRQLGLVRSSARHLLELVNDVLDLSRIQAGRLEVDAVDFDPRPLLARAVEVVEPLAHQAGLSLVAPDPGATAVVRGDPRRFHQVLLNLLGNAVKFTPSGTVRVWVRSQGDQARFEVQDSGPGLQAEEQVAVFAPFYQGSAGPTRRPQGTGLGLAISKRLVELMGGQIGVDSQPGHGCTFWFTLPVAAPQAPVAHVGGPHGSHPGQ